MKKIVTFLPITMGDWQKLSIASVNWEPLSFMEQVLDWSILPENSFGKLYAEIKDFNEAPLPPLFYLQPQGKAIGIRLAYSQAPELHGQSKPMFETGQFIIEGSEIIFKVGKAPYENPRRFQLVQSEWFKLPRMPNVSCLWIQAKNFYPGAQCGVAFVNLAIAEEV